MAMGTDLTLEQQIEHWLTHNPAIKTLQLPIIVETDQLSELFKTTPTRAGEMLSKRLRWVHDHMSLNFNPMVPPAQAFNLSWDAHAAAYVQKGCELLLELNAKLSSQVRAS